MTAPLHQSGAWGLALAPGLHPGRLSRLAGEPRSGHLTGSKREFMCKAQDPPWIVAVAQFITACRSCAGEVGGQVGGNQDLQHTCPAIPSASWPNGLSQKIKVAHARALGNVGPDPCSTCAFLPGIRVPYFRGAFCRCTHLHRFTGPQRAPVGLSQQRVIPTLAHGMSLATLRCEQLQSCLNRCDPECQ